jgi:hypothetical protein
MGGDAGEESRDLYRVLGVSPTASADELRRAYRAVLARFHPDRNPTDPKAAIRFKRVVAAYEVLGDPLKRAAYDELTRPIEDHDAPTPPPPASARAPAPEAPQPQQAADPPPMQEHVYVRDQTVLVTNWRLLFSSGQGYSIHNLDGVALLDEGRDIAAGVLGLLMVVQGTVLIFMDWATTGKLSWFIAVSALCRCVFKSPKYWIVLGAGGQKLNAWFSYKFAWTRDVVHATHAALLATGRRNVFAPYLGVEARVPRLEGSRTGEAVLTGLALWVMFAFAAYVMHGVLD